MPHIKGFGRLSLDLVGESRQHLRYLAAFRSEFMPKSEVGQVPTPEERPFEFCPETDRTWVSLMFQPDEELPGYKFAAIGPGMETPLIPQQLRHFRNLLPLTEGSGYRWIEFTRVHLEVRVSFFVKGKIRSSEGLMRGLTRRLRGYKPEEEVSTEKVVCGRTLGVLS